jgi:hypothetical protein
VPQPDWRGDVSIVRATNCKGSVVGAAEHGGARQDRAEQKKLDEPGNEGVHSTWIRVTADDEGSRA